DKPHLFLTIIFLVISKATGKAGTYWHSETRARSCSLSAWGPKGLKDLRVKTVRHLTCTPLKKKEITMHSPVTSTLRGKDITAAAVTTTAATTTCQVDVDVAARATQSLLDAFNADPIKAVQEEIMVAIGTPVLDINPDNPYHLNCSTDVAYMRIDTE